ncbi:hypothetical protein IFM89_000099, partial [Coptis chinensis]
LFFSKPTLIVSSASIHTDIEKKELNKSRNPAADFKVSSSSDLRKLSLQPFPLNRSPYFQLNMSGNQDYTIDFNRPQPELPSIIQFPQYAGIQGPTYVPFLQAQMFVPTPRPSVNDT